VIERANNSRYGLGASVWGRDSQAAAEMALRLEVHLTCLATVSAFLRRRCAESHDAFSRSQLSGNGNGAHTTGDCHENAQLCVYMRCLPAPEAVPCAAGGICVGEPARVDPYVRAFWRGMLCCTRGNRHTRHTNACCSGNIELFIGSGRRSYFRRGYATRNQSRE
jgi:hypothetical protein